MLKIKGFKYGVGDVVIPKAHLEDVAHYLVELVIDDVHPGAFLYSVIDTEGDLWQASPIMLENDFMLKGDSDDDGSN